MTMKIAIGTLPWLVVAAPLALCGATQASHPIPRPSESTHLAATDLTTPPLALVYSGPGVLDGVDDTLERAEFVAREAGFQVVRTNKPVPDSLLRKARLWVQPGGPNFEADTYMSNNGMAEQVRSWVQAGGGFVSFCGGTYSAFNSLKLMKGQARTFDAETSKQPIQWFGKLHYIHFETGPYLILHSPTTQVVGTYSDGKVAVARDFYGNGRVFVSGVHPEASPFWSPAEDPDGLDTALAIEMIQWVTANTSGNP
jgi:glutamine amidotransferase-like uncharacterized protein